MRIRFQKKTACKVRNGFIFLWAHAWIKCIHSFIHFVRRGSEGSRRVDDNTVRSVDVHHSRPIRPTIVLGSGVLLMPSGCGPHCEPCFFCSALRLSSQTAAESATATNTAIIAIVILLSYAINVRACLSVFLSNQYGPLTQKGKIVRS